MARIAVAVVLALVAAGGTVPFRPAAAQAELGGLAPEVRRYVPPVEALGDGWTIHFVDNPGASPRIFRAVARVVYAGPDGARVVLFVWTLADNAREPAWQAAGTLMDQYREAIAPDVAGIDPARVRAIPPPTGCYPVKWAEGVDFRTKFVGGLTLCGAEPDVLLLAAVSGDLGGLDGAQASDRVVELALAAAKTEATPVSATS